MADSRRWNKGSSHEKQDFVRPPSFRDGVASDPLEADNASWHGSGSRTVTLAAVIGGMAAIGAIAFMLLAAPGGAPGDLPTGGVAAQGDDDPLSADGPSLPSAAPTSGVPGPLGNATSGLPTPTLPP